MSLTASDCLRLKYLHILETSGEAVLTYILKCGTNHKSPSDPLDVYLQNLPQTSTANYKLEIRNGHRKMVTKHFNGQEKKKITSCPSCDDFDITLLFKSIQIACEEVAGLNDARWTTESNEMEYLLTKIKDNRNNVVHERTWIKNHQDFQDKTDQLEVDLVSLLEATKVRYGINETEFLGKKKDVLEIVHSIRKESVGEEEIRQRSLKKLLPLFITETSEKLQDSLNSAKYLAPFRFLSGHEDIQVDVQTIFSRIEMTEERNNRPSREIDREIEYSELLTFPQAAGKRKPLIVLIEGDAGTGKTTLLTYILSEWLKEENDRHMKGMDRYHLLLWIVCREETNPTLDDLLKQVLPEAQTKYRDLLLPLVKQCRVLFLIDGLDERNNVTHHLVKNILDEGKETGTFTAVCTCRPEIVIDFKATVPERYQISHVKISGISREQRTHVVLKHYQWLTQGVSGNADHLQHMMEKIGWMEVFRLPLNLLFLARMFYQKPESVNTTINQTQLYKSLLTWRLEKLQNRLVTDTTLPARKDRQKKINTVLKSAYQVALRGLLQCHIYLTEEDEDLLSSSCSKEGLPREEVMQALYTLQRDVTSGHSTERYCVPHKGLQEYFAAQNIMEHLGEYKRGAIKKMLQDAMAGKKLRLEPLRNMFCHLFGLLAEKGGTAATAVMEIIDLVTESGVKDIGEWIRLLADMGISTTSLQPVAEYIVNRSQGVTIDKWSGSQEVSISTCNVIADTWSGSYVEKMPALRITDGTVNAVTAMLPFITARRIYISLEREPADVDALARALAKHTVVELKLNHHYAQPDPSNAASENLLRQINRYSWNRRIEMRRFRGHLVHLSLLPQSLQYLSLAVAGNDHAQSLLPALPDALKSLPSLYTLDIHVPVTAVTPDALTPLPAAGTLILTLSGVGEHDIEAAWRIAAALRPTERGFWDINFPGASLAVDGWRRLVNGLAEAKVRVGATLYVPDTNISLNEHPQLFDHTESLLGCQLRRASEKELWGYASQS